MAIVLCRTSGSKELTGVVRLLIRSSSLWTRRGSENQGAENSSVRRKHGEQVYPQRLSLPESRGYVPTLSPTEVSRMLCVNEASDVTPHKLLGQSPIRAFESNMLASNNPTEDRRAVGQLLQTGGMVFGVYDGHGGAACAQSVSERLLDYIALSMLSLGELERFNHAMRTDSPMDLIQKYTFSNDYVSEEMQQMFRASLNKFVVETLSYAMEDLDEDQPLKDTTRAALKSAFTRLDADISFEAQPSGGVINLDCLEVGLSGACACVAHVKGNNLHVANLGDTRAVIGQQGDDGKWTALPMSNDHNPASEVEKQRVLSGHPKSEANNILKNERLLGLLIPLRAFGDIRFKWRLKDLKRITELLDSNYAQSLVPKNYLTPPYLINKPEVLRHTLTGRDKFLVIASDGLWEMLSNEEVVNLVSEHLQGQLTTDRFRMEEQPKNVLGAINAELVKRKSGLSHKGGDVNCTTHLIRHALGYEHRKVSEMLTFPPYISRHYRDDITITIVYFDENFLSTAAPTVQ